jgi:hypothetical protein
MNMSTRVVVGSCLGGILGGILGMLLSYAIVCATTINSPPKDDRLLPVTSNLLNAFTGFVQFAVWTALSGLGGAIIGSMVGAGIASNRPRAQLRDDSAHTAATNPDEELAQFKARIVETERPNNQER